MRCIIIVLYVVLITGNILGMDDDENLDERAIELALLSSYSPGRNGSYMSLPGTADPSAVLKKLKRIITANETKKAFQKFAQQCPPEQEVCARRAYLQRSILSCLDKDQQRKMLKRTQTLVSVSICCIKHLRRVSDDTQWTIDVSICPSAGIYVIKFPHIEDICCRTTPEINLCKLIGDYPDHFIAHVERIVNHTSDDACEAAVEQDASGLACARCSCL